MKRTAKSRGSILVCVATLLILGCKVENADEGNKRNFDDNGWTAATSGELEKIKAAFDSPLLGLKDPYSIQFRNVYVKPVAGNRIHSEMSLYACGEFNSKNGFGAYVGHDQFAAFLSDFSKGIPSVAIPGSFNTFQFEYCRTSPHYVHLDDEAFAEVLAVYEAGQ